MNLKEWEERLRPSLQSNIQLISENIHEKGVFYDIGANVGLVTEGLLAIKPKVRCYLFEPVKEFYQFAEQKFLNKSNVFVENVGISYKECYSTMNIDPGNYGYTKTNIDVNGDSKLITLDYYIQHISKVEPDFIKIDVEDHGVEVMIGMLNYLYKTSSRPSILFETGWDKKYEKIISEYYNINFGYTITQYDNDLLLKKL
jgi:FkbM family methyltransferase